MRTTRQKLKTVVMVEGEGGEEEEGEESDAWFGAGTRIGGGCYPCNGVTGGRAILVRKGSKCHVSCNKCPLSTYF